MRTQATIIVIFYTLILSPQCLAEDFYYSAAMRCYKLKNYNEAAVYFEKACKGDTPKKAEAHYLLANCYVHLNKNNEAIKHYRKSILINHTGLNAKHSVQALKRLRTQKKKSERVVDKEPNTESKDMVVSNSELTQPENKIEINRVKPSREDLIRFKVSYLIEQGKDLILNKRPQEGEKLLIEALHKADRLGSESKSLCNALNALAKYYDSIGMKQKAVELLIRQHRVAVSMYGRFSREAIVLISELAQINDSSSDFGPTKQWAEDYVKRWEDLYRTKKRK